MIQSPSLPTRRSSHTNICTVALGMSLLASNAVHAATMSFQEGVSPNGSYTTSGVTIRADGQSSTNHDSNGQIIVGRLAAS
ncbi:hypothetical protein QEH52_07150 [Coraliomargarita sp. SDUM461003]|uniref:Uncharacterized protein n=1 Tax=Thalassobacterium maritimum TaxID=3041265 RepID=A0ABU1AT01_9BACT|nr:hypothetical protein [Coraliomargarita sp. SDUM461003]MDQ8207278.1 hypothetical protein [Coraliomargarita sp. SDUM461003]